MATFPWFMIHTTEYQEEDPSICNIHLFQNLEFAEVRFQAAIRAAFDPVLSLLARAWSPGVLLSVFVVPAIFADLCLLGKFVIYR